jgi:hypothetical protein
MVSNVVMRVYSCWVIKGQLVLEVEDLVEPDEPGVGSRRAGRRRRAPLGWSGIAVMAAISLHSGGKPVRAG